MTDLIEAAARAAVRGSLLFHLDLAQILAINALPPGAARDWAVEVADQGYVVTILNDGLDREAFAVTFAADGSPISEPRDRRADPRAMALASARRTALDRLEADDGRSVVVLPPAATSPAAPLEAYLLDHEPGEDHRLTISADGRRVLATARLTAEATPTEAQVYRSLKHGKTLAFTTANGARWRVAAGQISRLD